MKTLVLSVAMLIGLSAHAAQISNCKVVEDTFQVPMIDEMSGITTNGDGSLVLALSLQVPKESGGSVTETISETFKNPTGVNKDTYKSNGLTLKLESRPTDGSSKVVNVVARVKGEAQDWDVNVLMICEERH